DETLGRFLSVDPLLDLADPQQWNGYAYANNNPTSMSDPSGLAPIGRTDYEADGGERGGTRQAVGRGYSSNETRAAHERARERGQTFLPPVAEKKTFEELFAGSYTTRAEVYSSESYRHGAKTAFSALGVIPVVGEPFDGGVALVCAVEGDSTCAALSATAMIPFVGWFATAARQGRAGADVGTASERAAGGALEAIEASTRVAPWAGASVSRLSTEGETMYRVWGGGAGKAGSWITPIKPSSAIAARQGLALPSENAATFVSEVTLPAGVRMQVGQAGSAFGQPGGWPQAQLLERIPMSSFGPAEVLK
ncbi:RHS repeat-associated core domain-containing protein, partial [Agromyces mediolanus]|uniref:RHS repeat-associated core domain-containing protein n=1 Tax=Agromyces mediolanus TaxID=41986 RepID=UPI001E3397D7